MSNPAKDDGYDWVSCRIKVRVGGFIGSFPASLLASEMVSLLNQLRAIHKDLKGKATFETIEEQLKFDLQIDKTGHISTKGEVRDEAGTGNRLIFEIALDQTHLAQSIQELTSVISSFGRAG